MGIKDFVPAFLSPYHRTAMVSGAKSKCPDTTFFVGEINPEFFNMPWVPGVTRANGFRAPANESGTHTLTQICQSIGSIISPHMKNAATWKTVVRIVLVADSSDSLDIKTRTRASRAIQWIAQQRKDDSSEEKKNKGMAEYSYPKGSRLVDDGILFPGEDKPRLINMQALLHSERSLYRQLIHAIHDWIAYKHPDVNPHCMVILDMGEGTEPTMVVGSRVTRDDIPLDDDRLHEEIASKMKPPPELAGINPDVYVIHSDRLKQLLWHTTEGDMGLIKWLRLFERSKAWLRSDSKTSLLRRPAVIKTIDTDVVAVWLATSHPEEDEPEGSRQVLWFSSVSGIWDLTKVRKSLSASHPGRWRRALLPFGMFTGCDFFDKSWATDKIGISTVWAAFQHVPKFVIPLDPEERFADIASLDAFMRLVTCFHVGVFQSSTISMFPAPITIPQWSEIANNHAANANKKRELARKRQKTSKQETVDASSASVVNSKANNTFQVNRPAPEVLISRAVPYGRALNYWNTIGMTMELGAGQKQEMEKWRTVYGRTRPEKVNASAASAASVVVQAAVSHFQTPNKNNNKTTSGSSSLPSSQTTLPFKSVKQVRPAVPLEINRKRRLSHVIPSYGDDGVDEEVYEILDDDEDEDEIEEIEEFHDDEEEEE